ncbi:hypothetical protein ACHAXN_003014 [Cyclotella atomus]
MKCYLLFAIALNIQRADSLLTFHRPVVKRQSVRLNVGISHIPPTKYDGSTLPDRTGKAASKNLSAFERAWRKYGMIAYIAHMCVAIPVSLIPTLVKAKFQLAPKAEIEHEALRVGQACARNLLSLIPFMNLKVIPYVSDEPTPTIWVSNHVSMLDTFVFLAADETLRGKNRRPIKVIYWKGLDANPICRILFSMAGFIPVDMEDNGNGNPNEYHPKSFKQMMKSTKQAITEGFDVLVLPEGQLNPRPEEGLQPIFPGAFALAKSSHRPIQMVALHGCHNMWHADENIGMKVVSRDVTIKAYPPLKNCETYEDFREAFTEVVGSFGSSGYDIPDDELRKWMDL